ncbi:tRNA(His) guanylyltransferase Thg1 family protein [bacterium]|nr:tRNA(His) guanylyltransferase Thg1 family protein [bacterium]
MATNDLEKRMKEYEYVTRTYLTRRTPVIIRIDGKAFHTFTKKFNKPFDDIMVSAMQDTMKYLCENIEGCVMGYTQSDEITLILCDYKKIASQAWFDDNIQKMCSVSASMATMAFNRAFKKRVKEYLSSTDNANIASADVYEKAINMGAMFDSRVFNIPKEEVNNCLLWRQIDATRNSIESVAQAHFPHKMLHKKNTNMLQDLLWTEKNINWNDTPTHLKRGSCCVKKSETFTRDDGVTYTRNKWTIDMEPPIFSRDTSYVNDRINFE